MEAAKGTTDMAINIIDVNGGASETGSASTKVVSSAQSLSSESNHLKMGLKTFLSTARLTIAARLYVVIASQPSPW